MQRERVAERRPARLMVASYPTYRQAQRAVDYLSDQKFPVERVAIVAEGLRLVEQVTGRLNYGRVALNGAISGAFIGVLVGLLLGLLDFTAPVISMLNLALWGLMIGAVIGALVGIISYAMSSGQRDFESVSGFQADHYNILVDTDAADEAGRLLDRMSERQEADETGSV